MKKIIRHTLLLASTIIAVLATNGIFTTTAQAADLYTAASTSGMASERTDRTANEERKATASAQNYNETATGLNAERNINAEETALAHTHIVNFSLDDDGRISTVDGSVLFPVNQSTIPANAEFIKKLKTTVRQRIDEQHLELYRIEVRGAASPEGSTTTNERLAQKRTRVLIDTITSILPTAKDEIFHSSSVAEDYEYLLQLLTEAHDPDLALVESICKKWSHSLKDLKWALYTAKGNTLWKRLVKEYFPALRVTRVELFFRTTPETPAVVPGTGQKPDAEAAGNTAHCRCTGGQICYCTTDHASCCSIQHNKPCASTDNAAVSNTEDGRISTVDGKVIFTVNKTSINPGSPFIKDLREHVLQNIREQHLELYSIDVRGAASPEGPTANNERLATGRTRALVDTITSILPTAKGEIFHTTSVTEDYEYLIQLMKKAGDRDAAYVEGIYEKWKHSPKDLKWALYSARKNALWKRLLKEYFPELRATRVTLHFRTRPDAPEEVFVPHCHCRRPEGITPNAWNDSIGCYCVTKPVIEVPPVVTDEPEYVYIDVIDTTLVHRRPLVAISTNLIYDLWYQPDYGFAPMWNGKLEFYPRRGHFTYAAGFTNPYWHNWSKHKFFQIRNYELEARWYLRHDKETGQRWGLYLGAAIDNNVFGIGFDDNRGWQGEGLGGQITGGYVLPISKCKAWKLELNLGAGFYQTNYDPYIYDDPYAGSGGIHGEYDPPTINPNDQLHYYYKWYGSAADFKKRQYRYRWLGPTQIGISLKYDLIWKRQQRRGASFRHYEQYVEQHRKEVRRE